MKLYSEVPLNIHAALEHEKNAGRIDRSVYLDSYREFVPQGGGYGYQFKLTAFERNRGRRRGNAGSYGSSEDYAATYDEWGWLLADLYARSVYMRCGSPTNPYYRNFFDFTHQTGASYAPDLADMIERSGDPYPVRMGRWQIGRRGYFRRTEEWAFVGTLEPRTADWARAFYAGEVY